MASKYLSSLSADKYKELTIKLHHIQNGKCFICRQDIDLDLQTTNIDHIVPLSNKGKDNEDNFALTHENCNKSKQDANLNVARSLFKLKKIQDNIFVEEHRAASLRDLLCDIGGSKYDFKYKIEDNEIVYSFEEMGDVKIYRARIFTDDLSKEQTCFIYVPIEYLFHDEIINPRGINNSINLLVKEFFKGNPQLHLTLARIEDGKIRVFDGQHKAAAQILLGEKLILVRLFINPDVNKLTETNANAGSKLRQIAFDKSIMRQLNNTLYAERVKTYQEAHCLASDDFSFSEIALCDFFKGENIKKYIIDALKSSITNSDDNKLRDFIDFEGKHKSLPISHSAYDKTFLAWAINSKNILNTPMNFKSEDGLNPRELEISQICKLLTIFANTFYIGKFNPEIGTYKIEQRIIDKRDTNITDEHLIAFRISKEEIIMAIMPYLEKIIDAYFLMNQIEYTKESWFQTPFPTALWNNISNFFKALYLLPLWKDRSMATTHFSGKKTSEFWKTIFATGKTPDQVQVLSKKLDYMDMVKPSDSTDF